METGTGLPLDGNGWITRAKPYAMAAGAVVVAALVKVAFASSLAAEAPYLILLGPVLVGAWFGGFPAGATATVLGLLVQATFGSPARASDSLALALFAVVGLLVSLLGATRGRLDAYRTSVLQREQQARAMAEVAAERSRLLAEASATLDSTPETDVALVKIARITVPAIADHCVVDLVMAGGRVRRVASVHVDPVKAAISQELSQRFPPDGSEPGGPRAVIRTGISQIAQVDAASLAAFTDDPEHLRLLLALEPYSYMCVPITARGRIMGAITFVTSDPTRPFRLEDLALAEDLGRRVGAGVDNARLYEAESQARRAAERAADTSARLHRVTVALADATTTAEVARVLMNDVLRAVGAHSGWVVAIEKGRHELIETTEAMASARAELEAATQRTGTTLTLAARTGEPVWLGRADAGTSGIPPAPTSTASPDLVAFAALPLVAGGRRVGVLGVRFEPPRLLDASDRAFAMSVARQGAQALARAQARAQLEASHRQLAHSEKLSALGALVAGVAHEIRTPLTYITNNMYLIRQRVFDIQEAEPVSERTTRLMQEVHERNEAALEGVDRINHLVRSLKNSARLPQLRKAPEDLREVVAEAIDLFESTHRGRVAVIADLQETPPIEVDREGIQQVILNLFTNASEAMPNGGHIRITVAAQGQGAQIVVDDDGPGLPPEVQTRMFEPFFTTKAEGSGLGLSISRRILEGHGGTIRYAPDGGGARFIVTLPPRMDPESGRAPGGETRHVVQ